MNADAARRDPPHGRRAPSGPPSRAGKKRVRHFTADDRAAHREFEKSRRKAFRERLTDLATRIPALSNVEPHKLSKHVVVEETIARQEQLEASCVDALGVMRALAREREELLAEVNSWRAGAGIPPRGRTASASSQSPAAIEANAQLYQRARLAYAEGSAAEINADYQSLCLHGDQICGTEYADSMAPTTEVIGTSGLPDDDLVPMWSSMDAPGVPVAITSEALPVAPQAQYQTESPRGNRHLLR